MDVKVIGTGVFQIKPDIADVVYVADDGTCREIVEVYGGLVRASVIAILSVRQESGGAQAYAGIPLGSIIDIVAWIVPDGDDACIAYADVRQQDVVDGIREINDGQVQRDNAIAIV